MRKFVNAYGDLTGIVIDAYNILGYDTTYWLVIGERVRRVKHNRFIVVMKKRGAKCVE